MNLTVGGREVVAIIGPSGCGKTTLLRCIGLISLTQGRSGRGQRDAPARSEVFSTSACSLEDRVR